MDTIWGILSTIYLLMSFGFAFLPGMFGLANYKKNHGSIANLIATGAWLALLMLHLWLGYVVWEGIINNRDTIFSWLLLTVPAQIIFFTSFGRDVGTS